MIESRLYSDGQITQLSVDELRAFSVSSIPNEGMIWIDMCVPSQEETDLVFRTVLPIHELALEDLQYAVGGNASELLHHPKIEDYGTHLLIIVHALVNGEDNEAHEEQLNILIGNNVLVTHRGESVTATSALRSLCDRNSTVMHRGPDYLLHLLLDQLVDDYVPFIQNLDDAVSGLERIVFSRPSTRTLARLLDIKRRLQRLRRVLAYQREIANRLSRGEFELVSREESYYYRNVYDHLVRLIDQIDEVRDLTTSIMEAYFSVTSARLNEVMKVLTLISTVFLPITFITSLYGMNFSSMPELHQPWGYPAVLVLIAITSVVMVYVFRKRGWIG